MDPQMIPALRKSVEWAEAEHTAEANGLRVGNWRQETVYVPADRRPDLEERFYGTDPVELQGCGSSYCIAGWIVAQHYGVENPYRASLTVPVMPEAQHLLGIDEEQADALFSEDNDIEDVRRIAEDIAGERL